jgi:hypothetical protein
MPQKGHPVFFVSMESEGVRSQKAAVPFWNGWLKTRGGKLERPYILNPRSIWPEFRCDPRRG